MNYKEICLLILRVLERDPEERKFTRIELKNFISSVQRNPLLQAILDEFPPYGKNFEEILKRSDYYNAINRLTVDVHDTRHYFGRNFAIDYFTTQYGHIDVSTRTIRQQAEAILNEILEKTQLGEFDSLLEKEQLNRRNLMQQMINNQEIPADSVFNLKDLVTLKDSFESYITQLIRHIPDNSFDFSEIVYLRKWVADAENNSSVTTTTSNETQERWEALARVLEECRTAQFETNESYTSCIQGIVERFQTLMFLSIPHTVKPEDTLIEKLLMPFIQKDSTEKNRYQATDQLYQIYLQARGLRADQKTIEVLTLKPRNNADIISCYNELRETYLKSYKGPVKLLDRNFENLVLTAGNIEPSERQVLESQIIEQLYTLSHETTEELIPVDGVNTIDAHKNIINRMADTIGFGIEHVELILSIVGQNLWYTTKSVQAFPGLDYLNLLAAEQHINIKHDKKLGELQNWDLQDSLSIYSCYLFDYERLYGNSNCFITLLPKDFDEHQIINTCLNDCLTEARQLDQGRHHTRAGYYWHLDILASLIEKDKITIENQSDLNALLRLSSFRGNTRAAKAVIAKGAEFNDKGFYQKNSLHIAAQHGHTELIEYYMSLITNDVINELTASQETALMLACQNNHVAVVKALLKNEFINANLSTETLKTALIQAVESDNQNIVAALIESPRVDINYNIKIRTNFYSALLSAIKRCSDNTAVLDLLLSREDISLDSFSKTGAISLTLQKNDVAYSFEDYLSCAIVYEKIAAVQSLLKNKRCNINSTNLLTEPPLILAAKIGNIQIINMLLKHVDVNTSICNRSKMNILMIAVEKKDLALVELVLKKDPSLLMGLNNNGYCALDLAIKHNQAEIIELLLSHWDILGPSQRIYSSKTLQLALNGNHLEIILKICHEQKKEGLIENILLEAITRNNNDLSQNIVNNLNPNLHSKNNSGETPLILAIKTNNQILANFLIKKDISILQDLNKDGYCALDLAIKHNQKEIIKLLLSHWDILGPSQRIYSSKTLQLALDHHHVAIILKICHEQKKPAVIENILFEAITRNNNNLSQNIVNNLNPNLHSKNNSGETPLILAIKTNNQILANFLIKKDISILQDLNKDGHCAIDVAMLQKNRNIINTILDCWKDSKFYSAQSLNLALKHFQNDVARNIIKDLNIQLTNYTPIKMQEVLFAAIEQGLLASTQILVDEMGANINSTNEQGDTSLIFAINNNQKEISLFLASKNNMRVNHDNNWHENALLLALNKRQDCVVEALLNHPKIDINAQPVRYFSDTPLITAVENLDAKSVNLLLAKGNLNINHRNHDGNTALILAIKHHESLGITESLINHPKIDLNAQNNLGQSALIRACLERNIKIVNMLLQKKNIKVDQCQNDGNTALMLSITNQDKELTHLLLNSGKCDINYANSQGDSALKLAVLSGNTEFVSLILTQKKLNYHQKDHSKNNALILAVQKNHKNIVRLLLNKCSINDKNATGESALTIAAREGYLDVLKLLLSHPKININHQNNAGDTALSLAIQADEHDIALFLLEQVGIKVSLKNKIGHTALSLAIEKDNTVLLTTLLLRDDINPTQKVKNRWNILEYALYLKRFYAVKALLLSRKFEASASLRHSILLSLVRHNQFALIKSLSRFFSDVLNLEDATGATPLFMAVENCNKEITQYFLEHHNININIGLFHNKNPLLQAASHASPDILKMLLAHEKTDVNFCNFFRETALLVAISNNRIENVELLLEKPQIDVNHQNAEGNTALMLALIEQKTKIVTLFAQYHRNNLTKIDFNCKNKNHQNIIDLAEELEIGRIILQEIDLRNHDNQPLYFSNTKTVTKSSLIVKSTGI